MDSPHLNDGPTSPCFFPVPLKPNLRFEDLPQTPGLTEDMAKAAQHAPRGEAAAWGIPFQIDGAVLVKDQPVTVPVTPFTAGWLVFMHTSDGRRIEYADGWVSQPDPRKGFRGEGHLNEPAAGYVIRYEDGSEARAEIRRRRQIGMYARRWGEQCFEAVAARKPRTVHTPDEQPGQPGLQWGESQPRVDPADYGEWVNWLWAWENPHPEKTIVGFRFEPAGAVPMIISAVSAGAVDGQTETPLRWRPRHKALLRLPEGMAFDPHLDEEGRLAQIRLDMGQVISALPRPLYPEGDWAESFNNQLPEKSPHEVLIEYTAHPAACFHLWDGKVVPVSSVEQAGYTTRPFRCCRLRPRHSG